MAELSTTWQPRLLLQSFCGNSATVSSVSLSTPQAVSSPEREETQVLFSLSGGSLFAVALDAAARSADETNEAEASTEASGVVPTPDEEGQVTAPAFLRSPFAAPQQLVDEEVEEGLAAFAACDLSLPSASSPSSATHKDGFLVTAGASTGLVRCFRVYVQPKRQEATPEEDDDAAEASRGLQLLRAMQQRKGKGKEDEPSSPFVLNGENGSGAWLRMEELVKWKSSSAVARLIALSPPFEAPFLLSKGRKALCRCLAIGCADGAVECHLLIFFEGRKKSESEQDGRLTQLQVVQRCFVDRLSGEAVSALKFHPSRLLLAFGGERGSLRLVDLCAFVLSSLCVAAGRPAPSTPRATVHPLADHMSAINSLCFAAGEDARQSRAAGMLVSAGGDRLLNFWNLNSLSENAGDLEATAAELSQRRDKQKKERSKAETDLAPAFQLPTSELVTAMVYVHPSAPGVAREPRAGDKQEPAGVLVVGGEQGTLFVFSLQQRKFIRSIDLPTRSAASVAASLASPSQSPQKQLEDFNAVVRSLALLPRRGSPHLLAVQESGAAACLPLALFFSSAKGKPELALKPTFFIGRMDGILGIKFLPEPPACACPCCSARRASALGEAQLSGRGKRKRGDVQEEDSASRAAPAFPRSLVALVGERQPWVLRLDGPAGEGHPVGYQAAACAAELSEGHQGEPSRFSEAHAAPAVCCDVSRK
ncbi:WD domain, G-beta repeat protein, partial [Toxoplasma gondii FOU]